jgi:hypothetical protein
VLIGDTLNFVVGFVKKPSGLGNFAEHVPGGGTASALRLWFG